MRTRSHILARTFYFVAKNNTRGKLLFVVLAPLAGDLPSLVQYTVGRMSENRSVLFPIDTLVNCLYEV